MILIRRIVFAMAMLLATAALAETSPPAQVMLLGTFHFSDPGKDAVKTRSLDVTTAESQQYLADLSQRIARTFRPTRVLLEYAPDNDASINQQFAAYVDGKFELPVNEIYQLGFRIARLSGLDAVGTWDHREVPWQAGAMIEYAEENDPAAKAEWEAEIAAITAELHRRHDTLSLPELLALSNDPADFAANKALYVSTNAIGAGDGYSGADAAASWWHRNFRMYANVQRVAQPGERVLVIGGSGHIAVIADLLALDAARMAADVRPLL